jgi:hypothetical protein
MARTIWLAAVCLAVLGAMAVGQVLKAPSSRTIHETSADRATIDASGTQEPLAKADRLQLTNVHQEATTETAPKLIEPVASDAPNSISTEETVIVNRHWHDPYDANSATKKQFGRTLPTKNSKSSPDSRSGLAADRNKPPEQTKPCNRTGIGNFLRSLNLSPACDS